MLSTKPRAPSLALQEFDFNVARHDVLGAPTLNVGTIQGGLNINSVPDRALIGIDIRTIPAQNHAQIREQLSSYLGPDVALKTLLDAKSVWTDPGNPWIGEVFRVARSVERVMIRFGLRLTSRTLPR